MQELDDYCGAGGNLNRPIHNLAKEDSVAHKQNLRS